MENSPNLFLVGFQKCGSSTLFDLLTQHKDIIGSVPKETFYLSDKNHENYSFDRSIHNMEVKWSTFFLNSEKTPYWLEASVGNFFQDTALQHIKRISNAKVIFILRDPASRFLSNYLYYGTNGVFVRPGINLYDFYNLVKNGDVKRQVIRDALKHGHYHKYIDRWTSELGEEKVFLIGLKPLTLNPLMEMNKLFRFLEISEMPEVQLGHKNKSSKPRYPALNAFLVKYLGGHGLNNTFLGRWYNIMTQERANIEMPSDLKDKLIDLYKEEYKRYEPLF